MVKIMTKFRLDKLVRDGLLTKYEALGQVPTLRELTSDQHLIELSCKGVEEFTEIKPDMSIEEIEDEVADVLQVVIDIIAVRGLSMDRILHKIKKTHDDKGDCTGGTFVEVLELRDDDIEWTEYYRSDPNRFPEIKE